MNNKGIIIIGGGGHARVLTETIVKNGMFIIGYVEKNPEQRFSLDAISCLGGDDEIFKYRPDEVFLVNAVGSVNRESLARRRTIFERFSARGYSFPPVVSRAAFVAGDVDISDGVQIMASSCIQIHVSIGKNTLLTSSPP